MTSIESLYAAAMAATDPDERDALLREYARLLHRRVQRARSVPVTESR